MERLFASVWRGGKLVLEVVLGTNCLLFLRWASEGLSLSEIAMVENLPVCLVEETLRRATQLLGATSLEEAIYSARFYQLL